MKRALFIALAFAASPAFAIDEPTTAQWISNCRSEEPTVKFFCLMYVKGMGDYNGYVRDDAKLFCPPPNVTLDQMARIAVKHAEANPEVHHIGFGAIAVRSFRVAFPCPRQQE